MKCCAPPDAWRPEVPMRRWMLLGLGLLALSGGATAIADTAAATVLPRGRWPVQSWVTQDLGAAQDNYDLVQLPDGRLLVANLGGLLLYDGARWRFWNHPDKLPRLGPLAVVGERIYASYTGDFGYYAPDGRGAFDWHSLAALAPEPVAALGQNLHVAAHQGAVYYLYNRALLRFHVDAGRLEVLDRGQSLANGALVDGSYWYNRDGALLLADDRGVRPGPESLGNIGANDVFVDARGTWFVGAQRIYHRPPGASAFVPFLPEQWPRFLAQSLVRMVPLHDSYALLFRDAPLELIDAEGRLLDRIGPDDGVPDNPQRAVLEDRDGALWVAQLRSITRIDRARGISRFDASRGLKGADELVRWQADLLTTDSIGLYRLQPGAAPGRFVRELPMLRQVSCVATIGSQLLVGGDQLVVADHSDTPLQATPIAVPGLRLCVHLQPSRNPDRAWLLHNAGVVRIDWVDGQLVPTPLPQFQSAAAALAEDGEHIWVSDRAGRLWRSPARPDPDPPQSFDAQHDLPKGPLKPFAGRAGTWFATAGGLRRFDAGTQRFVAPAGMPDSVTRTRVYALLEDQQDTLWLRGDAPNVVLHREGDRWRTGDALLAVNPERTIHTFRRDGHVLWLARTDDILRIDLDARRPLPAPLPPLIARAGDPGGRDGIALATAPTLDPGNRGLQISFGLPAFERAERNQFRSRLDSVDAEFTAWSPRSEREFTNLADGPQVFELEARDVFGRVSRAAPLRFRMAPPWYRTSLAWSGYGLLAVLALLAAARLGAARRTRAMLGRQRELEAGVAERTAELHGKNLQLAEQAERLQTIDQLKTRFFVNVGHEFRTPLTLVLGPLEDLLGDTRGRLSESVRNHLQLAQRNARRVLDLIVELLDVNRMEHGRLPLRTTPQDLATLLRRVATEQAPVLERYGQSLVLALPTGPAPAQIDPAQIERCLVNLLGNAAKYSPRGTHITLGLAREEGHWLLSVRDQGRGMAAEALPHVFDRFFQVEGSDRASGYGIGLSLVREIARAHGGDISATSTLGAGSCFTLRLPAIEAAAVPEVVAAPASPPAAEPHGAAEPRRGRERVLVVDDHEDLRARLRALLGERFEVLEAADGEQAWRLVRDELPDLVVSDVMMPGCDGVELTRRVRAHADTGTIGLLLLTAMAGSEHAVAGLRAGANDYLAKPFDASELLARCEAIVAHARRLQHRLAAGAQMPAAPEPAPVDQADARWRQRLERVIAAHLHEAEFGIEALAAQMHADRSHLFRRCKELLGLSPSDHLRETRLQHAHRLLESGAGNISEVGYASGFDSLSSFTRAFKARYGVPPSQIRARAAS